MRICVVIPAFNEEKAIADLIKHVKPQGFDVIVVDDGSKDNTVHEAASAGAVVLEGKINKGKGAALKKAFKYVLENQYDAIITMDADGQHSPDDLKNLVAEAKNKYSHMVVGNRMSSYKNMPMLRILTNKIMSLIISLICQQDIPDTQCGFRFISSQVLKDMNLSTRNYEVESEMLIRAAHKGYKIHSCAIKTIYAGERSEINPFVDTFRFCKFLVKYFFKGRNA